MAKKKARKKKKEQLVLQARTQTVQELLTALQIAIDHSRDRRAFALSRQLLKHSEWSESHLAIVTQAYVLRLLTMLDKGQGREAMDIYSSLVSKYPRSREHIPVQLLFLLDLETGSRALLDQYLTETGTREAIDDFLRYEFTSLPKLAAYRPGEEALVLQHEAVLLLSAWEEVESASGGGIAYQEMLKVVGRRSPLVNWRLFIQGLQAFYQQQDEEAREIFQRIGSDSPLFGLSTALLDILNLNPPGSVGKMICLHLEGDTLRGKLQEIDELIARQNYRRAEERFVKLVTAPGWGEKRGLQKKLTALFVAKWAENDLKPPHQLGRLPHLTLVNLESYLYIDGKDPEAIEEVLTEYKRKLSPVKKALLLNKLVETHTGMLSNIINSPLRSFLSGRLRGHIREFYPQLEEWLQESAELYPLQETFSLWFQSTRDVLGEQKAEKVLEKWYAAFPAEPEPLLQLVNSCRRRGVYKKALRFFEILDRLAKGNPAVEKIRHYLYLDDAVNDLKKGKPENVQKRLAEIAVRTGSDLFLEDLLLLLEWLLVKKWKIPGALRELEKRLIERMRPLNFYCIRQMLLGKDLAKLPELPALLCRQWENPEVYVNGFAALMELQDPAWSFEANLTYCPPPGDFFARARVADELLLRCLNYLYNADPDLDRRNQRECLWQLTGNALAHAAGPRELFLAYRGVLLADFIEYGLPPYRNRQVAALEARRDLCFGAAYFLALNNRQKNIRDQVSSLYNNQDLDEELKTLSNRITDVILDKIMRVEGKTFGLQDLPDLLESRPARGEKQKKERKRPQPSKPDRKYIQPNLFGEPESEEGE